MCRVGDSGYNSRWARIICKECINSQLSPQLDLVVIFFGANDAVLPNLVDNFSRQHVPSFVSFLFFFRSFIIAFCHIFSLLKLILAVEEYEMNLKMMVAIIRSLTNRDGSAPRIFIVGPPPVDDARWHRELVTKWSANVPVEQIPCNRSLANAQRYNEAARAAAAVANAPFIDLCGAVLASGDDWRQHLSDGLHLSASGNALLYALLRVELDRVPRDAFLPSAMVPQFPHHATIDRAP